MLLPVKLLGNAQSFAIKRLSHGVLAFKPMHKTQFTQALGNFLMLRSEQRTARLQGLVQQFLCAVVLAQMTKDLPDFAKQLRLQRRLIF